MNPTSPTAPLSDGELEKIKRALRNLGDRLFRISKPSHDSALCYAAERTIAALQARIERGLALKALDVVACPESDAKTFASGYNYALYLVHSALTEKPISDSTLEEKA